MGDIINPVLPGFNPDPSIIRVGEDYYIATSTFEWYPGVQIHHSKDLVNWRLLTHPLKRLSQLNMIGNIDSGGVWAPCLSYDGEMFYLVYTDVKSRKGAFKDTHNYVITAKSIDGTWSEPTYLNSSGFDPSLFHDDDGRKWLVNMIWDHRKGKNSFSGIALQEFSLSEGKLIGPVKNIFKGTDLGLLEAPHLYKRNQYYYLITAEGGTGYNHAVTIARSKQIDGPYEVDPTNPILTSGENDELKKAGHASLVETTSGEWYLAHLCGRPVVDKKCVLGRETALQKCYWTSDGWLRVEGGNNPKLVVPAPNVQPYKFNEDNSLDNFTGEKLKKYWSSLRRPFTEDWVSLTYKPGYLTLFGQESMSSFSKQSLIARRLQSVNVEVETAITYNPLNFQQMAGLIIYYDTDDYIYLRVTYEESKGKCLGIIQSKYGVYDEILSSDIEIPDDQECYLKAKFEQQWLTLYYSLDNKQWHQVGPSIDYSHLSDEDSDYIRFTGTFVGMAAQDLSGQALPAFFKYFKYNDSVKEIKGGK